jgi:Transposase, Mutator family
LPPPHELSCICVNLCQSVAKRWRQAMVAAWLLRWQEKYPRLCAWVEENIEETLTFYRLPREHHKHLKSTNMLERLNHVIKRRTHVIRIFPNEESACDSFALSPSRSTRTGSKPIVTSTWKPSANSVKNFNSWMLPKVKATASSSAAADSGRQRRSSVPTGLRLPQPRLRRL